MPASLFEAKTKFRLTPTDKTAFDPEKGAANDITWWAKLYFDMPVFNWQHFFYHHPAKDKMVIAGIRVGKSKGASLGMLHFGHYHPGSRILNTSISSEQAKICYYNMMELITMDRFKHWVEHIERSPYPLIRLVNGTEFWFRSIGYEAELIRGFQFDLIHTDECAYITSEMAIKTLRGRLLGVNAATKKPLAGLFWQSSSPKGKSGWVYERWKKGDPRFDGADPSRYLSLRVRTIDNPLLDRDALREIMADYTDKMIAQELEGAFLDSDSAEFALDDVMACCSPSDPEVIALNREVARALAKAKKRASFKEELGMQDEIERYELEPAPGRQYMASWDLGKKATKAGRNATVGMVFDITTMPWKMVAYRYEQGTGYLPALTWIEEWQRKFSSKGTQCYTVIDASGKGDVLNEIIEAEQQFQVDGIVYNAMLKPNLITAGKISIERGLVRFPYIKRFVDQLAIYEQNDKDLPQDTVMSFCQLMYKAREFTGMSAAKPTPKATLLYRRPIAMEPNLARMAERRRAANHMRSRRNS